MTRNIGIKVSEPGSEIDETDKKNNPLKFPLVSWPIHKMLGIFIN